jgi:alpha-L-fucosidase
MAQTEQSREPEDNQRLDWWREARFGMFIHWGLYALPAGVWKDEEIPGLGEWIMHRARIPVQEYEKLAGQLNPVRFDADAWVRLARDAGMKYLCITSKHHDGFALFGSKASSYNLVDATPFGRDAIKELAEACHRHGLRFCVYYSHAQDWHHPDGAGNNWDYDEERKDFARYLRELVIPQVRELLTNYGPLGLIWFDTPRTITPEQSKELTDLVHELQPNCLVSSRVGHGYGDYRSMGDNQIPGAVVTGDWETPATLNDTWGFKSYDHNWKSVDTLVYKLVDIVSKGGNYLLNVGPTAEGLIPEPSVERLQAVGEWMKVNGEAVYGSGPTPFRRLRWRCTTKPGKLFLHLFDWPAGKVEIPGLLNPVTRAYLLADPDRAALPVTREGDLVTIALPQDRVGSVDSVLVVEIDGAPQVTQYLLQQAADGSVELPAAEAALDARFAVYDAALGAVTHWTNASDFVFWDFEVHTPGTFEVVAAQACPADNAGGRYTVALGDQRLEASTVATASWEDFQPVSVGTVTLAAAGSFVLSVKPEAIAAKALMNLRSVTLRPVGPS